MKKFAAIASATLLCTGALVAQGTKPAATAADPVIMSFGTTQIHESEFNAALASLPEEYQQFVQGSGKKQFAEDYLRMKVLAAEGMKGGLDKDPKVISQLALMRDNTLANAQLQKLEAGITLAPEELQKAYDAKKSELEKAKARHILVAFKGSPAGENSQLTEEQAKAKADGIRNRLIAGGDFAELAKAESDDKGSAARGGDLGSFGKGQMVPEFDKAVFEGKINEIGPIVRTQFGYHIIQVQERNLTPMDEIRPQLEQELKQARLQALVQSMKDAAKPVMNEAYFAATAAPAAPPAVPPAN